MNNIKIKKCTGPCGKELDLNFNNFTKRKDSKDGFRNECKKCLYKCVASHFIEENGIKYQICTGDCKLKLELNEINFGWRNKNNNKYHRQCKICMAKYKTEHYQENKEEILIHRKEYYEENKEEILIQAKEYYEENKDVINIRNKEYYEENKEEIKIYKKEYYEKNEEEIKTYKKEYYEENKEEILLQAKEHSAKPEIKQKRNERTAKKLKEDPAFRLMTYISRSVWKMLKNQNSSKNGKSSRDYLPFTKEELINHIEEQFKLQENEWMNWDNQGVYKSETWDDNDSSTWVWNLDHIISQKKLKFDSMEHPNFIKCWALSNLRPYSAKQNIIDGARE